MSASVKRVVILRSLQTLRRWFDGPDCPARRLRRQMRDTIGPLLRGQRTLAAVGGHVSRRAELLDLAARLESAVDDRAAWRLWCAATGLFSIGHLPGETNPPAGSLGAVSPCTSPQPGAACWTAG
nr:DUF2397 family protein [uncultured Actinoplanes sp.]